MAMNRGKQFEEIFKRNFLKLQGSSLTRLADQMSGYKGTSQNICDFIGYVYPNIFYAEVKSIKGNTFPLSNLTQYPKLALKVGIKGVRSGVIIWYQDHDRVLYVPTETITQLKKDNKKSVNIRKIDQDGYRYIEIPCIVKRVYPEGDYSVLCTLNEGD